MTRRSPAAVSPLGLLTTATTALVLLAAPGCGSPDAARLLDSASMLLAQNDHEGAKLQAKSVLQTQPDSGPARLLLGRALLAGGDLAGAEAELRRALALSQPLEAVLPALAQALVRQGKGEQALQLPGQGGLKLPQAEADFKTELAAAHGLAGRRVEAQAALAQAMAAVPGHGPARLLAARLRAGEGDLSAAQQQVAALLADQPRLAEAWLLKAELLLRAGPAEADGATVASAAAVLPAPPAPPAAPAAPAAPAPSTAVPPAAVPPAAVPPAQAALLQALAVQPDLVPAHQALVALRMKQGDLAGAQAQFARMKQVAPRHPQTLLLEAALAEQAGELPRARELSQLLLRAAPNHLPLLLLAAQIEQRQGALAQAEALLARALQQAPVAAAPRLQLARVQLQGGQADKALQTLKPLTDPAAANAANAATALTPATAADAVTAEAGGGHAAAGGREDQAQALTLAGQAQQVLGAALAAQALFARAAALQPKQPGVRTTLALARLAQPQPAGSAPDAAALAELQAVAAADKGHSADLALVQALQRGGDSRAALAAVDRLEAKRPEQALPALLRAQIALQQQQPAEARRQFEHALARQAHVLPALEGLARLDLAEQRVQAARARLAPLLQSQPVPPAALRLQAEILARSGGAPGEVTALLRQAVQAEPGHQPGQIALVGQLLGTQAFRAALDTVQAALATWPEQPELLAQLGQAQLALGQPLQAVTSFSRLAQRQPQSPWPQLRLAEAQARAGQSASAAQALAKAAELAPNEPAVLQAQAAAALQRRQFDTAQALARRLQTLQPSLALGHLLAGDVALQQKQWATAATAYRRALVLAQPGDSAQRLHSALIGGGQQAEARRLAADWRQRHPDDLLFAQYLGDIALAEGHADAAEAFYREVLAKRPQDPVALNNLAYTLALQKKPGAVTLARQALLAAPDAPAVLDTLAFCLAAEGELPQALLAQGKAVQAAPEAPMLRLQLARLQLQAGDKSGARAELAVLARLGSGFARQAEVAALLKSAGT